MDKHEKQPPVLSLRPWDRVPELQQFSPWMRYQIWECATSANRFGCIATVAILIWIGFLITGENVLDRSYWAYGGSARSTGQLNRRVLDWFVTLRPFLVMGTLLVLPIVVYKLQLYWGRRAIRHWLINTSIYQRAPACLACGYSLLGTPAESTACPECGKAIPKGTTPEELPAA